MARRFFWSIGTHIQPDGKVEFIPGFFKLKASSVYVTEIAAEFQQFSVYGKTLNNKRYRIATCKTLDEARKWINDNFK